ncbi:MAG TPA: hypothetical protein VFA52_01605 [Candidatus Paceibacterota bacterium]|nr:hypothetical protein [Candidatus Paceibacterota bacterium]
MKNATSKAKAKKKKSGSRPRGKISPKKQGSSSKIISFAKASRLIKKGRVRLKFVGGMAELEFSSEVIQETGHCPCGLIECGGLMAIRFLDGKPLS